MLYCITFYLQAARLTKPHLPRADSTQRVTVFYDSYMSKVVFKGLHFRYTVKTQCFTVYSKTNGLCVNTYSYK